MSQVVRMDPKKKAILERIRSKEDALTKAQEYLETGAHADWHGFRAFFTPKIKDGREVPPHRDWAKNVFIPGCEKATHMAERKLDKFEFVKPDGQWKIKKRELGASAYVPRQALAVCGQ